MIIWGSFESEGVLFLGCMLAVAMFVMGVMALTSGLNRLEGQQTWLGGKRWMPASFGSSFMLVLLAFLLWTTGLYIVLHLT